MNDTMDEIGRVMDAEDVRADYARQGLLSLARISAQVACVQATVAASADFGLPDQ